MKFCRLLLCAHSPEKINNSMIIYPFKLSSFSKTYISIIIMIIIIIIIMMTNLNVSCYKTVKGLLCKRSSVASSNSKKLHFCLIMIMITMIYILIMMIMMMVMILIMMIILMVTIMPIMIMVMMKPLHSGRLITAILLTQEQSTYWYWNWRWWLW